MGGSDVPAAGPAASPSSAVEADLTEVAGSAVGAPSPKPAVPPVDVPLAAAQQPSPQPAAAPSVTVTLSAHGAPLEPTDESPAGTAAAGGKENLSQNLTPVKRRSFLTEDTAESPSPRSGCTKAARSSSRQHSTLASSPHHHHHHQQQQQQQQANLTPPEAPAVEGQVGCGAQQAAVAPAGQPTPAVLQGAAFGPLEFPSHQTGKLTLVTARCAHHRCMLLPAHTNYQLQVQLLPFHRRR